MASRIRDIVAEHDISLISAYHVLPAGLTGAWVSRMTGVPMIMTVFGEVWVDDALSMQRRLEAGVAFEQSSLVLAPSEHCANGARRFGYSVTVSYYGIALERFTGLFRPESSDDLVSLADRPVIAYVARMEEEMGISVLLDALPTLLQADDRLVVCIAGRPGAVTARARLAEQEHAGRVLVLEDPDNATVADVYAAATVVVVPSTNARACLGLAIAEASAAGRPVVVSDVGGGPEILGPLAGVLIPPHDPDALATAALQYIANPDIAREAGEAGRAFVSKKFNQASLNAELEALFDAHRRVVDP